MMKLELRSKWHTNSILRYLVVGSWNTLFGVILLYVLFFFFNNKFYEYELCATYVLSTAQSYTTQRLVVWKSSTAPKAEFSRFVASTISQYIINSVMLYFAVHGLKLKPTYAALPIMLTIAFGFYFVNRNLVFRAKSTNPINGKLGRKRKYAGASPQSSGDPEFN